MAKTTDFKAEFKKQRAAGVDIAQPMNNLITKKEPEPAKEENAPAAGIVIHRNTAPRKTKRLQLLMTPELYYLVKAAAEKNGVSFNEFVSQVLGQVVP